MDGAVMATMQTVSRTRQEETMRAVGVRHDEEGTGPALLDASVPSAAQKAARAKRALDPVRAVLGPREGAREVSRRGAFLAMVGDLGHRREERGTHP